MNKPRKSTMKELVQELEALNHDGQYDQLIANARSGRYHDYKNPDDVVEGKLELIKDLSGFPMLTHIRSAVIDGDYDEEADEEDKEHLRSFTPKNMWHIFGL